MIKVLIKFEEKAFESLEVSGHADTAPCGHDLVCAAVSGILTGCTNAIKDEKNFHLESRDGYYKLEALGPLSSHDEGVIDSIIVGLQTIASEYGKFIQIKNL